HIHAYVNRLHSERGFFLGSLHADAHFLNSGVTTAVDTGTAGAEEIAHFRRAGVGRSITRRLAYVNIAAPGMGGAGEVIRDFDVGAAEGAGADHRGGGGGIKTAHYWTGEPFDAEPPPWESVEKAVEAGRLCNKPVMVDFWPRPPERPYPDLILK